MTIPNLEGPVEELYIQNNPQLHSLPTQLGSPRKLRVLHLSDNALKELPSSIQQYDGLRR